MLVLCAGLDLHGADKPAPQPKPRPQALLLSEVLASVQGQYPPYLAALIEMDMANGRVRQALGSFDLNLNAGGTASLAGYYDGNTGYAMLEQPLPFWGGSVHGGYRLSSGYLPNYNKDRTGVDGETVIGFKIPLLRDGTIDRRRAALWQAQIDQELADPIILRQYLDFIRAAGISYYTWVAAGQRLTLAEELLRVAKDRDNAIAEQVRKGASAPVVQIDNRRLVVSREIAVVQAQRRLQATAIELSLFYRTRDTAEPIIPARSRVPSTFPAHPRPDDAQMTADIAKAAIFRPEIRRIELLMEKTGIDRRLAKNNLLPSLDVGVEAGQFLGENRPKDLERNEVEAKIEFKLPLQRREAKGRMDMADATLARLEQERLFTRDKISADVRDSYSALDAAFDTLRMTRLNVDLARQLEQAETERLKQGATDLLALQIREQASFDARVLEVDALAEYFRAQTNYRAAMAADAPRKVGR
ncbi:multidrug transporter [Brevifollis gellanilyticus]|uniref:Multidrug transporter n=2 Tax=Brevifollis gellanilyticus TaxID=748831 RepID=A0A512MHV7_9BACT|nr:multidrug transporter [Brevifollis gellanilyticus]